MIQLTNEIAWKGKNLLHLQNFEVKIHDHYTGKYRGAGHSTCNSKYIIPKKFLWFFIMDQTMIIILS